LCKLLAKYHCSKKHRTISNQLNQSIFQETSHTTPEHLFSK
jgi:hypothetical protein